MISHPEGDEARLWLTLKPGVKLDFEKEKSIDLTLTVDDGNGGSASTTVTVNVEDVNEAPTASGDAIPPITGTAGEPLEGAEVNLLSSFSDPDGDVPVRYTVSGAPSWLTFSVAFGEDDNGNPTATGLFTGTPPTGADSATTVAVTINAIDAGGLSASTSVRIIVDDGVNEDITAVDLLNDAGNVVVDAEVKENDASGPVLGEIRVTDSDDPGHPSGEHLIQVLRGSTTSESPDARLDARFEVKYDDAGVPWLAIKEGSTFNHEMGGGFVDITIRAVDLNGATNARGTAFTGNVEHRTITVEVTDQNDAPRANPIGNWWVTAEEGLRSSDADGIAEGRWLTFKLDMDGTGRDDAFTDPDGDPLTYSLSGPSILEIDENGVIRNAKGALPIKGNHKFTVTATDPDGLSASSDFYVAIALSGDGTDTNAGEDNNEPDFSNVQENDYTEGDGDGTVVATFTVTDDDNALGHHPFALESVRITNLVISFDEGDDLPVDLTSNTPLMGVDKQFADAFELSKPRKSGNAWTYDLIVRDDPMTRQVDETDILDHDEGPVIDGTNRGGVDSVEVTVTATDGQGEKKEETIDVDIEDRNEAPEVEGVTSTMPAGTLLTAQLGSLQQSMDEKVTLYINLEALWSDPDDNDDPDELTFTADASSTSWIRIVNGPFQWDDRPSGVNWPASPGPTGSERVITDDNVAPAANDDTWVVIVEIDRTGSNNGQGDRGSFTLTAKDDRGGPTGTLTVPVVPTDQNLPAPENSVTISGVPREDATLRATFNDDRDPDLRGATDPALVLYQWFRDPDTDNDGTIGNDGDTPSPTPFRVSTDSTYKLTQEDVGMGIRVMVQHYEIHAGQLVSINSEDDTAIVIAGSTPASRPVSNTPDAGTGSITILADANALTVPDNALRVTDEDRAAFPANPMGMVLDAQVTFTWEVSDNGRGGWTTVDQVGDTDTQSLELRNGTGSVDTNNPANGDGQGKYYRAVATYDADGIAATMETESVYSAPVRVGNINDRSSEQPTPAPTVTGSAAPGGTLTVNANVPGATVSVQWQMRTGDEPTGHWSNISDATGTSLTLTQANVGQTLRAVVSYEGTNGVTAIVTAAAPEVVRGTPSSTALPVKLKDYDIEATVTGTGHGPDRSPNDPIFHAGHNLSLTETVDLRSLFQDPDSARLTFTVDTANSTGLGSSTAPVARSQYVFAEAPGGLLTFNTATGEITFNSDVYRGHDGTPTDGAGNVIKLSINANDSLTGRDSSRDSTVDAAVNLRINVAPTGITFENNANGSGDTITGFTTMEYLAPVGTRGEFIAYIDVQDENLRTHKFGTHEVTVSDDRFMVVRNNYDNARAMDDGDGSTWELRLKPGVKLDFETESDADMNPANGKQIVLTLTATDGGDLSTPAGPGTTPIRFTVTVTDRTNEQGDTNHPLLDTTVPGLDDVGDDSDDETKDGDDTDTDGGAAPSMMDAMMMSTMDDGLF